MRPRKANGQRSKPMVGALLSFDIGFGQSLVYDLLDLNPVQDGEQRLMDPRMFAFRRFGQFLSVHLRIGEFLKETKAEDTR